MGDFSWHMVFYGVLGVMIANTTWSLGGWIYRVVENKVNGPFGFLITILASVAYFLVAFAIMGVVLTVLGG